MQQVRELVDRGERWGEGTGVGKWAESGGRGKFNSNKMMRFRSIKGISQGKKAFLSNFFSNNTLCTWLTLSLFLSHFPLFFIYYIIKWIVWQRLAQLQDFASLRWQRTFTYKKSVWNQKVIILDNLHKYICIIGRVRLCSSYPLPDSSYPSSYPPGIAWEIWLLGKRIEQTFSEIWVRIKIPAVIALPSAVISNNTQATKGTHITGGSGWKVRPASYFYWRFG